MYHGNVYTIRMRFSNRLAGAVIDEFGKDTMNITRGSTFDFRPLGE